MIKYISQYTLEQIAQKVAESAECDSISVLRELQRLLEEQR